jgi:hypothetical protein
LFTYDEFRSVLSLGTTPSYWHGSEIVAACIVGFSAYSLAAFALTVLTIVQFDEWIERPRQSYRSLTGRDVVLKPEPEEEIVT